MEISRKELVQKCLSKVLYLHKHSKYKILVEFYD